ncbi:hypothetical protein ACA910_011620 [Epithemia clementina (nom. ined.)]
MFDPALPPPRSSDHRHHHANSASTTPTQSIPIHPPSFSSGDHNSRKISTYGIAMKRSSSELRLLEEERQADLRDYIFFIRLGQGISNRQVHFMDDGDNFVLPEQEHQDFQHPGHPALLPSSSAEEERRRRRCSPWLQRQNELCLAHIIGTRNGSRDHYDAGMMMMMNENSGLSLLPPATNDECHDGYHEDYYHHYNHNGSNNLASAIDHDTSYQPQLSSPHEDIFGMDW